MSRELFGTDGVRGTAGVYPLNSEGVRRIGMAVGTHFAKKGQQIVIGQDTRESSPTIAADLTAGLNSAGIDVVSASVIPTPGLAYITAQNDNFVAGVMITASHNTYEYNGIKVFDAQGNKLTDEVEALLNKLIIESIDLTGTGKSTEDKDLIKSYEDFLVKSADGVSLNKLSIAIDSANGSASGLARNVFTRLGAEVITIFDNPNGTNINENCGATHTSELSSMVRSKNLTLGVALDGDADRLIMIDSKGREVKGDYLLYILAVTGKHSGVVATFMSNLGFEQALKGKGIELLRTDVGDRYVIDGLRKSGYHLGGEQSGHIIIPSLLSTGDGLLAAVQVLKYIIQSQKDLAAWCDEVKLFPQALVNIPLKDKALLNSEIIHNFIDLKTNELAGKGRVLIRPSGTEPLARVMVEAENAEILANSIAVELEELIATNSYEVVK